MKKILFSVTNDLNSDQRMWRICHSLRHAGYEVILVGRQLPDSRPLPPRSYLQHRMRLFFLKGPLFYLEYNLRLFLYALGSRVETYSAVDLDSLPAMWLASVIRSRPLVYDAHEIFTEVPEIAPGGLKQRLWKALEGFLLPRLQHAYTVNHSLAQWYKTQYGVRMTVVRNMPVARELPAQQPGEFILYQGALNAGRGLEALLEAAPRLPLPVCIAGKGDLTEWLVMEIQRRELGHRVKWMGQLDPEALQELTSCAWLGINLLEGRSLNYYYSLANKFFDYVQAGIPQLCANFPEYASLNQQCEVALLTESHEAASWLPLVDALWENKEHYNRLQANCREASRIWTWESEEKVLLEFYSRIS